MRYRFILLCATAIALLSQWVSSAQDLSSLDLDRIRRATVYVMQARGDDLTLTCVGSGTIVRYDGLILTNAHHSEQSTDCPGDTLIIAMSLDLNEPPIPKYRAEIVQVDRGLDLALLRITREFDGRLIDAGSLPVLPFVEIADSDNLALDNTVTLVGYAGVGNNEVTSSRGSVTGFIAEPSGGEKSWVKVSAVDAISGTMTGGGAYNLDGRLVGIPTSAPVNTRTPGPNCKLLEDTNRDGFINNNDDCVPIGDFISVMRPANFARPLLRSAALGLSVEPLTVAVFQQFSPNPPRITRIYSAPSVVDGLPATVVGTMPAGTNSHYLFFDYQNMNPETVYELRVTINGSPSATFSLPPVRWSGRTNGLWYIGGSGQPWPNGVYEFRLFIDGVIAGTHQITIGTSLGEAQGFSNVVFGLLDSAGNLQGNGYVLPGGTTITGRFIYRNMEPGTTWTAIWYYNDAILAQSTNAWNAADGTNGVYPLNFQAENGFLPGNYRLDLYIGQNLALTGDFVIAGAQEAAIPRVFSGIRFLRAANPLAQPTGNPSTSYPDGANTIFALFDWEQLAPGTPWTMQWSVDNEVFLRMTQPWSGPESGGDFATRLTASGGLPDGTYRLELLVNGRLLASEQVAIGIGQLAIDRLAQAGGVQLRGQIIDAETNQGIAGATFILISEDFSIADFVWDETQIYALANTDRNGRFEIDRPLQIGAPYSVLINVRGYLPIAADGFTITPEDGAAIEMLIPLTKD